MPQPSEAIADPEFFLLAWEKTNTNTLQVQILFISGLYPGLATVPSLPSFSACVHASISPSAFNP